MNLHSRKVHPITQQIGHLSPQSVEFVELFDSYGRLSQKMSGWQEIVFHFDEQTGICRFMGVDVYIGTPQSNELLFGTDCEGLSEAWNTDDLWSVILPFCETVLSLSQNRSYIPIVRIDCLEQNETHSRVHFFSLNHFDYFHRTWMMEVSSLANPTTFLEH